MTIDLIPDRIVDSIYDLDLLDLRAKGVRLLLADLDNTIARYHQPEPDERLRAWYQQVEAAGITFFVLSNGRRPARSRRFCESLGAPYLGHAGKPKRKSYDLVLGQLGVSPSETVMLGDQIFTDIWGGHNAGARAVLVRPIALDSLFRRLRYAIESPFRGLCHLRGDRI